MSVKEKVTNIKKGQTKQNKKPHQVYDGSCEV